MENAYLKTNSRYNNLLSAPYKEISLQSYFDNLYNTIQELFQNYIYINWNTCEDEPNIPFYMKKYEILEIPFILSINTNINGYVEWIKYFDFINKI